MPRKNPIPRERRLYITADDIPNLPKGIHVYRGVYGGLYVDKEELRRYRDQITDERLRSKIESDVYQASPRGKCKILERFEELEDKEEIDEYIMKFVKDEIVPIVRFGRGSVVELEDKVGMLREMLSMVDEKGVDLGSTRRYVNSVLAEADMLMDSDYFDVNEISKFIDEEKAKKILRIFEKNRPTATEILEDLVYEYGDIFEEIYDYMKGVIGNLAVAWRLSKIFYLLMCRMSDEGNYPVSRVLEKALVGITGGKVRPESDIVYILSGETFNSKLVEEIASKYVDEKSVRCWLKFVEMVKNDIVGEEKMVFRGLNDFERLMLIYRIADADRISGAVLNGNILTSCTTDINIADSFSPVIVGIDLRKTKIDVISGEFMAPSDFVHEKEITVILNREIPCKLYDYDGSYTTAIRLKNGEDVDSNELLNLSYEITDKLAQIGYDKLKEILSNEADIVVRRILEFGKSIYQELKKRGEKEYCKDILYEIKYLSEKDEKLGDVINEIFGGELDE